MTPLARACAVAAGLVALLAAVAAFVREVVLAAQPSVEWSAAHWWSGLASGPAWRPGLAAGISAALAVALLLLAARQVRPRPSPGRVELAEKGGRAQMDVAALEPALRRRLQADLPGVTAHKVLLRPAGERWWARVEADLPLRDLLEVQRRAVDIVTADLRRVGGLEVEGVDIIVTGVVPAGGAPAQKKTRE